MFPNGEVKRNEDTGSHAIGGFITEISPGPANESGQTVSFTTTNDFPALFAKDGEPKIDNNGTLTFTLAADRFGTANVTVVAKDNGGTDNGGQDTSGPKTFKIIVTNVNDQPTFDAVSPAKYSSPPPAGVLTSTVVTNANRGPFEDFQTLKAEIVSVSNPGLFTSLNGESPAGDATGTTFPVPGTTGDL